MKVAVIGCGHWGHNLVRVFHEIGVLGAVCDVHTAVLIDIETRYPGVRIVSDPGQVLRDPNIEAVAIATPAATHYWLARRALKAGKHVLVEKPLALHSGDAEELVVHAETEKRTLMVGHLLRYHPAIIKLRDLCARGDVGRIEYVYFEPTASGQSSPRGEYPVELRAA